MEANNIIKKGHRDGIEFYRFYCTACEHNHIFFTEGTVKWSFNGDMVKPTFSPSLVNYIDNEGYPKYRCHLFVKDGMIQYLNDCTHKYAGKTIPM